MEPYMNKGTFSVAASLICIVLVTGTLIFQFRQQKRIDLLTQQNVELRVLVAQSHTNLSGSVAAVSTTLSQQNAVLHRALGKVIPIEIPNALSAEVQLFEAGARDQTTWPKGLSEAQQLQTRLEAV